MATFLIEEQIPITRQAGDTGEIVFEVPVIVSLINKTLRFQVIRTSDRLVLLTKDTPRIVVEGQIVTIPLLEDDTQGKVGVHIWELEVSDETNINTIGQGPFTIVKTWIP